jgi:hypothetical protein
VLSVEEVQFGITATKIIRQFSVPVADLDTFFVEQIIEDDSAEALASEILGISSFPKKTQVVKKKKFTIKHLKGNIFYTIVVTAVNKIGSSDTSISSKPSSTKPPIVPALILDAPIISDIEPTKAKIRWSLPEHDGGSKIQSFWLEYSINDGTFDDGFAVYVPNEYQADFLTPKTQYRFRIAATNAVGRAIFSPPSVVFNTPSLVEFTIQTYFANRPAIEHDSARVLQVR